MKGTINSIEQIPTQHVLKLQANIVLRCESSEALRAAVRRKTGVGVLYFTSVKSEKNGGFKMLKLSGAKLAGLSCPFSLTVS